MTLIQALEKSRIIVLESKGKRYYAPHTTIYMENGGNEIRLDNCKDWPVMDDNWRPMAYDMEMGREIVKR